MVGFSAFSEALVHKEVSKQVSFFRLFHKQVLLFGLYEPDNQRLYIRSQQKPEGTQFDLNTGQYNF